MDPHADPNRCSACGSDNLVEGFLVYFFRNIF